MVHQLQRRKQHDDRKPQVLTRSFPASGADQSNRASARNGASGRRCFEPLSLRRLIAARRATHSFLWIGQSAV